MFVGDPSNESELVSLAKESPEAFGALYELYVERIYNYVYYRTGNHHDAEDLTAKAFYQALTHINQYVDRGLPFSAWLYRIAHNLVANWYRARSRRQVITLDELTASAVQHSHDPSPEKEIESRDDQAALLRLIRRMPDERQQLIILKFVHQLSNQEIGQVMGRSEGAIKSLYHRTLLMLRDQWAAEKSSGEEI
ncbi:MAG: sigma-70 family RNA polymerase sigma factor [Anaerolineae bacterium]|nr:sigma-70 family RNA polymerase sigma factor [Anaerolineae bacterium]